jgi:hypothetical protein
MKQVFLLFVYILTIVFVSSQTMSAENEILTQAHSSGSGVSPSLQQPTTQNLVKQVSFSKENSQISDKIGIPHKVSKTFELPLKSSSFSKVASIIALGLMFLGVLATIFFIRRRSNSSSRP